MTDTQAAIEALERITESVHFEEDDLELITVFHDQVETIRTALQAQPIGEFDYNDNHIWRLKEDRRAFMIQAPKGLHPDTQSLVAGFAHKLAVKLFHAQEKYGYSDGWKNPDWMDECRKKLREHVEKGDPRDVAAYCAFLDWHQESTTTK